MKLPKENKFSIIYAGKRRGKVMISPGQPTKLGSHSSNLPAVGREVLDYEGFFIAQPNPEFNGNMGSVPHSIVRN